MILQFPPAKKVVNERWQLILKLVQFTGVHFLDPNPSSYDNLPKQHEIRFKTIN